MAKKKSLNLPKELVYTEDRGERKRSTRNRKSASIASLRYIKDSKKDRTRAKNYEFQYRILEKDETYNTKSCIKI